MAKKTTTHQGPADETPEQLRERMRQLDQELLTLISRRADTAHSLVRMISQRPSLIADFPADDYAIEQAVRTNPGPLDAQTVRCIFRELYSGIRALLAPTRVVYLGPAYSYSHLAVVKQFGSQVEFVPVATIAAVFEALGRSQAEFGLVPIENSTDGRVADTLDMFARMPVHVCGEVQLRIHHHLLAKCGRSEVDEVYSKPQALSQCRNWLARHLPEARTIETPSTTTAARLAAEKPNAAAIASREAGIQYGLDVITPDIEDNPDNTTRFAVIGEQLAPRTGRDRTSLMFEVSHQPGALADAMMVFKIHRLNLTWIESFPMPGMDNKYVFFVAFEGHQDDQYVQRALAALAEKTVRCNVLGSYPIGEPGQ